MSPTQHAEELRGGNARIVEIEGADRLLGPKVARKLVSDATPDPEPRNVARSSGKRPLSAATARKQCDASGRKHNLGVLSGNREERRLDVGAADVAGRHDAVHEMRDDGAK